MCLKSHQKTVSGVPQGFSALCLVFLRSEKAQMSLQNRLGDDFKRDAVAQVVDRGHAVSEVAESVFHGHLIPFPATPYRCAWHAEAGRCPRCVAGFEGSILRGLRCLGEGHLDDPGLSALGL